MGSEISKVIWEFTVRYCCVLNN